jgi:hypothetical protein
MLSKRHKDTDPNFKKGDTIIGALLTGTGQKMNIYPVQKIGRVHATSFHFIF